MRLAPSLVLALVLALSSSPAQAGRLERVLAQEGSLDKKDMTLPNGEFADVFPVELVAGSRVLIEMQSKKLDTFLVIKSPAGNILENDDLDGDNRQSQIDFIAEESGTWLVYATTAAAGERGTYSLRVSADGSGGGAGGQGGGGAASGATALSLGSPVQGVLQAGDSTLSNGEWVDSYTVELQAGQNLVLEMTATELDTYVGLRSPSGAVDGNDDHGGVRNHSRLERAVEESGVWTVYATTYQAGQGGSYTLVAQAGGGQGGSSSGGPERWSGSLATGDAVLSSGEFADVVKVQGQAGERWVVDLRSTAFDPFLIIKGPDGTQLENDDFEGAGDRSLIDLTLPASGLWTIAATTYQAGQGGAYDLTLRRLSSEQAAGGTQRITGTLAAGDTQLGSGEWFDQTTFEGLPGQKVTIDLRGSFDTYLGLVGPGGFQVENDDGESNTHSRIEAVLSEAGTYRVVATSYGAGQGGAYTLDIAQESAQGEAAAQRDVAVLTPGAQVSGQLQEGDLTLDSGEFQDVYVIEVQAGQEISVAVGSTEFDTYLALGLPDGTFVQNDDWEGRGDLSRVDLVAPETGRYRVFVTSYRAGSAGAYEVLAEIRAAPSFAGVPTVPRGEGRTFGLFMGISDYPVGGPTDLNFTADDARAMYAGMQSIGMAAGDGRLLVDSQVTRAAMEGAVRELAGQMGPKDRLVFFYSGHGGRVDRTSPQPADPDGYDETLALYDGEVRDDEVAELMSAVTQGTVLMVLDSCFSGGFSKDVINQPGRMGLFSSHEDVTSAVAMKFRAGGYLARFMVEALGERLADADSDGALTALELSQYLYERYRSDVKSVPQEKSGAYADVVMTGQNLGYQQIIVDRGGVGPSQVLFAW